MKKVAAFLSYLDFPYYAGLSKRITGLINALQAYNIKSVIISPILRPRSPLFYQGNIIRIDLRWMYNLFIHSKFGKLMFLVLFSINSIIYLFKLNLNQQDDLEVVQYESIYSFLPALFAKFFLNTKIIGDDIVLPIKKAFIHNLLLMFVTKYTDYIIVSSPVVYEHLKKSLPSRQVLLMPNGVIYSKTDFTKKDFRRIVFVGALTYEENIEALRNIIKLTKMFRENGREYEILVIGGPLQALETIDIRKTCGKIRFLGFIEEKYYERILESAYIGLLPFFQSKDLGGQRRKALEYMSHGILTISTSEGIRGIQGLISGRHYLEISSLEDLDGILGEALKNPQSFMEIAQRGRNFVNRHYNWDRVTVRYLKLIKFLFNHAPAKI